MTDTLPERIAPGLIAAIDEYLRSTDPGNQPPARCSACGFEFEPPSIYSSQPGMGWRCERCGGTSYNCTVSTYAPSADPRILLKEAASRLRQAEWDVHNLKREVAGKSCIQCGGSIDLEKGRCLECDEQETANMRELESLRAEVARLSAPVVSPPQGRSCCEPAPDRSGRTCDKHKGHDGDHWTYGGNTLTWRAAPVVSQEGEEPCP